MLRFSEVGKDSIARNGLPGPFGKDFKTYYAMSLINYPSFTDPHFALAAARHHGLSRRETANREAPRYDGLSVQVSIETRL